MSITPTNNRILIYTKEQTIPTSPNAKYSNFGALATIISVFFFLGFVAACNGVLIPMLKKHFTLSQFQTQLVDTAFFLAYGVGSLVYFII